MIGDTLRALILKSFGLLMILSLTVFAGGPHQKGGGPESEPSPVKLSDPTFPAPDAATQEAVKAYYDVKKMFSSGSDGIGQMLNAFKDAPSSGEVSKLMSGLERFQKDPKSHFDDKQLTELYGKANELRVKLARQLPTPPSDQDIRQVQNLQKAEYEMAKTLLEAKEKKYQQALDSGDEEGAKSLGSSTQFLKNKIEELKKLVGDK